MLGSKDNIVSHAFVIDSSFVIKFKIDMVNRKQGFVYNR
jgi:hypothetical protein